MWVRHWEAAMLSASLASLPTIAGGMFNTRTAAHADSLALRKTAVDTKRFTANAIVAAARITGRRRTMPGERGSKS